MRERVGVSAFVLVVLSLGGLAPSAAQAPPPSPPVPGFMPPYEITRIVRASGFDPLAPPLREGTTYVLRATDFRGILMRVVVDAHSGAIRAVNRIVAADNSAPLGILPPYGAPPYGMQPFGPPPYGRPPYGALPPDGIPDGAGPQTTGHAEASALPGSSAAVVPLAPAALAVSSHLPTFPPLPRPRPAELAAQSTPPAADQARKTTSAASPSSGKADAKTGAAIAAPLAAPVTPSKPAQMPIND